MERRELIWSIFKIQGLKTQERGLLELGEEEEREGEVQKEFQVSCADHSEGYGTI